VKRKVLFVASIEKHILRFHLPSMQWFKDRGFEVHVACNGTQPVPVADVVHIVPFERNPFSLKNISAFIRLKAVLKKEDFALLHCHTPAAGILSRLAGRKLRKTRGLKILYTAHGFHFYKGAALSFWLLFFPAEWFAAFFTDGLITINREDFDIAKEKLPANRIFRISGMGVDNRNFIPLSPAEKENVRRELGISPDKWVVLYVGEFIHRKNHEFIIRAFKALKTKIPELVVMFAGRGELFEKMKELASTLKIEEDFYFLGFRSDINRVINAADLGLSASRQEGLPLNLIEEMMCGLPVVATDERGHREIVEQGKNGYLFRQFDTDDFVNKVFDIYSDKQLYRYMSAYAIEVAKKFTLEKSIEELGLIYEEFI
jgi:glycosyltransferase EpsD